jgi:hypothetical protein
MSDNDGISGDIRSREEEYFRRKDRELVENLRRTAEADASRRALESTSGIHDQVMLQELEALGFTPDTVSLLPLVPIVQVAWAEGGVSDDERKLILQFARSRNIREGSPADEQLSAWLEQRPSEDVFSRATRLIRAMLDRPDGRTAAWSIDDLIHHCEEIAEASGGILGFRKISGEEKALLGRIQTVLKGR